MSQLNFTVVRGDTLPLELEVIDDDTGLAQDLTGWTAFMTIKEDLEDDDVDAVVSKTVNPIPSPTLGIVDLSATPDDTSGLAGVYYYDIQLKSPAGAIYTPLYGTILVEKDRTRRTS